MMKGQKGITLVALIITIIVMLILVGVSISVAMNGGLFDTAQSANRETKEAQVSEAIALTKAEIMAEFYGASNNSERTKPTIEVVKAKINKYLDDQTIITTVTATAAGYDIETSYDFDTTYKIEFPESISFATSNSGSDTNTTTNNTTAE